MSIEAITPKTWQVSRKPHWCSWCGQIIGAGERYMRQRVKTDGDPGTVKMHPECDEALDVAVHEEPGHELYYTIGGNPRGEIGDDAGPIQ